jgi:hypothetical protein
LIFPDWRLPALGTQIWSSAHGVATENLNGTDAAATAFLIVVFLEISA